MSKKCPKRVHKMSIKALQVQLGLVGGPKNLKWPTGHENYANGKRRCIGDARN